MTNAAPRLVPNSFTIDGFSPFFDGFMDEPREYWNGWDEPWFTEETMLKVQEFFAADPDCCADESMVLNYFPGAPADQRFELIEQREYKDYVYVINVDGTWLFGLGRGNFCWIGRDRFSPEAIEELEAVFRK